MEIERVCGHKYTVDDTIIDIFGVDGYTGACQDCVDTMTLYNDVYHAMAGNVYSLARVVSAGLVPGLRPSIGDLNRAGKLLYAQLTPAMTALIHDD